MKGIRSSQAIVALFVMALLVATGFGQEIHDDFNNGVLDPVWNVLFNNANGWTYSEAGTDLTVTDIAATVISHDGTALIPSEVMLARPVAPLGDFQADMSFSWSSTQSGYAQEQALQKILLRLMGPAGEVVAFCGYSDPWIHFSGSRYWNFGGPTGYGAQGSEPYTGSATVAINRVGSDIQMLWNGQPFVSGTNSTPVTEVQVFFSYFPFDGGGGPSFFGTELVDSINVTPEPATLSLLALGGLALVRRRRGKARKGNARAELRAMKGIRFSGAIVIAALFVMIQATTASASTSYGLGFTWNRWADWKPGANNGSSAGNPCKDSAGNPVWSYEYTTNVPAGSDLDTSDGVTPWYKLPSSGLMVWDGHTGATGSWGYQYDNAPFIFPSPAGIGHVPNNQSYHGDHFAIVPLVRWDNPSTVPIEVSLTSGPGFQGRIHYWPAGTTADLVIARTDASDGGSVHLLYSQTIVKTLAQGQNEFFSLPALDIRDLVLDPGDDILFSVRARSATTGYTWYSVMFDDNVNITVVPEPATIGLLAAGGLAMLRKRRK